MADPNLERTEKLNSLMNQVMQGSLPPSEARRLGAKLLKTDEENFLYFQLLYEKAKAPRTQQSLKIHENGDGNVFPTAIAPPELQKLLPIKEYQEIKASPERFNEQARRARVITMELNGGTGTSIKRTRHLAKRLGISEKEVKIGAKGTDLGIEVADPHHPGKKVWISYVEAQLLRWIRAAQDDEYGAVAFFDLVSAETKDSIQALWKKKSLIDPDKSYEQIVSSDPRLSHIGQAIQAYMPTLDKQGMLSFNREAPAGHGFFGFLAFLRSQNPTAQKKDDLTEIAVFHNGEDLGGVDPYIVGYVREIGAPITLVTTEKVPVVDAKGGMPALIKDPDGSLYWIVYETAQAERVGQGNLFKKMTGIVSTNMTLFNYEVLTPLIQKVLADLGDDGWNKFLKIIAADTILNAKKQVDPDGVEREYIQLESAMGQIITRFDQYYRQKYHEPLIHIVNVGKMDRLTFFAPVKTAFDYYLQCCSDRFELDPKTYRVRNLRPGRIPAVNLADAYYADVSNVMDAFEGASTLDLDALEVEGKVSLKNLVLKGKIKVSNQSSELVHIGQLKLDHPNVDRASGKRLVLSDLTLTIQKDGKVQLS